MDETIDNGYPTTDPSGYGGSVDSGSGYVTEYGPGYGDSDVYGSYQTHTQNENELWNAATEAYVNGDEEASNALTHASRDEGAAANGAWNEYNGNGEYAPTQVATDSGYYPDAGTEYPASSGYPASSDYPATSDYPASSGYSAGDASSADVSAY